MKITVDIEVGTVIQATLRDDQLTASATLAVPYGTKGRKAATSQPITDKALLAELRAVLAKIQDHTVAPMLPKARAAAHECHKEAINRKEEN